MWVASVISERMFQARELAMLICRTEDAIETFIEHCDVAARDLLMPHGDVVIALCIVLRIKRTMNGAEIDELISDVQARKARAIELARRAVSSGSAVSQTPLTLLLKVADEPFYQF